LGGCLGPILLQVDDAFDFVKREYCGHHAGLCRLAVFGKTGTYENHFGIGMLVEQQAGVRHHRRGHWSQIRQGLGEVFLHETESRWTSGGDEVLHRARFQYPRILVGHPLGPAGGLFGIEEPEGFQGLPKRFETGQSQIGYKRWGHAGNQFFASREHLLDLGQVAMN